MWEGPKCPGSHTCRKFVFQTLESIVVPIPPIRLLTVRYLNRIENLIFNRKPRTGFVLSPQDTQLLFTANLKPMATTYRPSMQLLRIIGSAHVCVLLTQAVFVFVGQLHQYTRARRRS